jgi:hypothetical protein
MWHVWGKGEYRVWVAKPGGRGPQGRWEDNIKIHLSEIGREGGGLRNKW